MSLRINAVVFDFDGVIIDSGADIAAAVQYAQKQLGRPVMDNKEVIMHVGRGVGHLIRNCFPGGDEAVIRQSASIYTDYYLNNSLVKTTLYRNVREVLEYLKTRKTAIVTNKPEDIARTILGGLGIQEYFDLVIGPESVNRMKPDPEGLLKALRNFGEKPENAIMVGDSNVDIEAGRGAGMYTCGVTYGLGDTGMLVKAGSDFLIDDIIKLKEIIM